MGGGASLPDKLDKEFCSKLNLYDEKMFNKMSKGTGFITKEKFLAYVEERTDVFLSHDWGAGQKNHKRVAQINKALKEMGIKTWFDEEKMEGSINEKMSRGIETTSCGLIFITQAYIDKVGGDDKKDNCRLEFSYAARKLSDRLLAVVMEPEMRDTGDWEGPVAMVLGGNLYTDMSGDFSNKEYFAGAIQNLHDNIMGVIKHKTGEDMGKLDEARAAAAAEAAEAAARAQLDKAAREEAEKQAAAARERERREAAAREAAAQREREMQLAKRQQEAEAARVKYEREEEERKRQMGLTVRPRNENRVWQDAPCEGWDAYLQKFFMMPNIADDALICGFDDGTVWAKTPGINMSREEFKVATDLLRGTANAFHFTRGFKMDGYYFTIVKHTREQHVVGLSSWGGCILGRSNSALIVAIFQADDGMPQVKANMYQMRSILLESDM